MMSDVLNKIRDFMAQQGIPGRTDMIWQHPAKPLQTALQFQN